MSAEAEERRGRVIEGEFEQADDVSIVHLRDSEEPRRACSLSGRILEAGELMEIVSFIAQSRWRGELVFGDGKTTRSLFFDEGQLVAAMSTASADRLRELLAHHRLLSPEQVAECSAITAERTLRFGEAAVELGYASREAVFGWLAMQVEAIALAVLRAESGAFAFFRDYEEGRLSFRRKHDVPALLERAVHETDDPRWFQSKIRSSMDIPVKAGGRTVPVHDPLGVYAEIDGKKNVSELAAAVGASELAVTRALFQHVQTGHATVRAQPGNALEIVEVYNSAILVLLRELDAMDEGDAVRAELTRYAANAVERPSFVDAPADDGTLDARAIESRLNGDDRPHDAAEQLARWLYDYASYALFLAGPHLERRFAEGDSSPSISQRVADLLEPIAPSSRIVVPPASKAPRVTIPAPPSSSGIATSTAGKEGPRSSGTVRMRRYLIPGIDPKRTTRIAPFAGPMAAAPISTTMPSPSGPVLHRRSPRPIAPAPRRMAATSTKTWLERSFGLLLVVVALAAGIAIGWLAHPKADPPPHFAVTTEEAVPTTANTTAVVPPESTVVAPALTLTVPAATATAAREHKSTSTKHTGAK